ncbi:phage tail spike protein [Mycoplasmopsis bovirhinis]|uniref:phage tail spike protein n=1 Tax=Mycoplasmopsis bovirhinis TaxID=29553 RepID=UPI000E73E0EB|nr:phage tail spike protein [Mycoplasmopsis bovirhinis]
MIPILYKEDTTNFSTYGIGTLTDTISCEVTEERNGVYECVIKYPVTGVHFGEITKERIIKAKPNDTSKPQAFRIYRITTPLNGIVKIYAQHISYDLIGIPVPDMLNRPMMPQLLVDQLFESALVPHNFTFKTEYTLPQRCEIAKPKNLRAVLGGSGGSVLDVWGGEFEWDNFEVLHHKERGANNGVVIEYGKNLTKLEQDSDISEIYTDLLPYAVSTDEEGVESVVTLVEQTLPITKTTLKQKKILIKDFTDSFESGETISHNELRLKAKDYIANNPLGVETPSLTISFEALWKQPEYPAILERVSLCDTVTVKHIDYGVSVQLKVIKTVYDSLLERYTSITLGAAKSNFINEVSNTKAAMQTVTQTVDRMPTLVSAAINNATKLITGQKVGYVILNGDSETSMPYELLVLDQPNIADAVNVWRWNVGGLGFSSNGYNGPYETAITSDGQIVADFITTGTLLADIIKAGIISSKDGSSYWNIDTGEVVIKAYATSDALNKAVEGLEGSIEKVETTFTQRATSIEARVSANETNISSLTVSVGKVETRVSTAEGNISSLTTDVSGIKTRVSNVEGDVSTIEQNVSSITTRVANAEGDISSLETSVSGISTRVSTAEGNISSLTQTVNSFSTRISTAEGSISTISQSVSSLTTRVATAEGDITSLEQTTSSLSATVATKVGSEGGSTSSFGWSLTSSGFYLYSNSSTVMSVTSSGLSVSGSITATSGTIGGFTIGSTKLYKTKTAYNNTTAGVYLGTDGIGLGAGTFYVTSAGYLYATSGKIGGMSLNASQMYSDNFILGTVYDANDSTKSFTTLSFGTTDGTTFTATTVLTNSGSYMYSLSSDYIYCGVIRAMSIRADAGISSTTGFYFGYSGGSVTYSAKLTWSGRIIYLKIYNEDGVQTALAEAKTFTVHYACIWGSDTTWNATVSKGSSSTSIDTNAFWGIDYATFNYSSSNKSQHTYYFTISGTSAATTITARGHIVPWSDNTYDLGSAAYKWRNIYGQAGVVNTSDRNEKFDILPMAEVYGQIFDRLLPVTFKYVDNSNERTHLGLVAQDVKDAILAVGLTTKEFAGYCEWKNEDESIGCGLRYSEFVAINIYEIQKLKARVKELEEKLNITEETNNET